MRYVFALVTAGGLAACGGSPGLDVGTIVDPYAFQSQATQGYIIGPMDKLRVTVLQVEELSFDEIVVDSAGNLQFPLIGSINAAGQTPAELSQEIQIALGARYIRNPQVNVSVAAAASQKVTVDGAVVEPGVYEMRGPTTLLQAVAMAKGPSRVAALDRVALFRTIDGRRAVAAFDLTEIRRGAVDDPLLLANDVVVVDTSRLSSNIQLAIQALPAFGVFGYFTD